MLGWIIYSKEPGHNRNDIKRNGDEQTHHGQAMAFEGPPDQLPLGRNSQATGYEITRAIGNRGGSSNVIQGELLKTDARVNQRQKNVADQRAKNG